MPPAFSMRVTSGPDVVFQTVGDEAVLLNMKTSLYLGLNAMGTRMWIVLTEADSIEVAYESLLAEFDVSAEVLRKDLEDFLAKLNEFDLINISSDSPSALDSQAKP
jgi:Coenzyme PQQ synthesis protein D (PqqD)